MNIEDVIKNLPLGQVFECGGRTISEGEFAILTSLTWTTGQTHTNREYMAATPFGERMLAGGIILPIMGGQASTAGVYKKIREEYKANIIALLGYDDTRFKEPLLPGDTMYVTVEVVDAKPTRTPNRGILRVRSTATKNQGRVIAVATSVYLFEV